MGVEQERRIESLMVKKKMKIQAAEIEAVLSHLYIRLLFLRAHNKSLVAGLLACPLV